MWEYTAGAAGEKSTAEARQFWAGQLDLEFQLHFRVGHCYPWLPVFGVMAHCRGWGGMASLGRSMVVPATLGAQGRHPKAAIQAAAELQHCMHTSAHNLRSHQFAAGCMAWKYLDVCSQIVIAYVVVVVVAASTVHDGVLLPFGPSQLYAWLLES